ncbi:MAG: hypothetical protein FJW96_02160 [Actinobacteria bacterium]|nr:hypothetical protein [Actinomycetota bacterium]
MERTEAQRPADRRPAALARTIRERGAIVIRPATPGDEGAIRRLAALASRPWPDGELTVVETGGAIVAAIGEAGTIADPFQPTADLIELLALRAEQVRAA